MNLFIYLVKLDLPSQFYILLNTTLHKFLFYSELYKFLFELQIKLIFIPKGEVFCDLIDF